METKKIVLYSGLLCSLIGTQSIWAGTITFVDNSLTLPGYEYTGGPDVIGDNDTDKLSISWGEDSRGKYLTKVTVNFLPLNYAGGYDTLFINNDYNPNGGGDFHSWNYVVHSRNNSGGNISLGYGQTSDAGFFVPTFSGLYAVDDVYQYNRNAENGRKGHPNGIDRRDLEPVVLGFRRDYDGFEKDPSTGRYLYETENTSVVYDFTNIENKKKIYLGENISFAYTSWCANDVISGAGSTTPVPLPPAALLFGTGLFGLLGWARRPKRQSA